jgi:hypothetical protein
MTGPNQTADARQPWIDPEISELDVRETAGGFPNLGGDVSHNLSPDCTHS